MHLKLAVWLNFFHGSLLAARQSQVRQVSVVLSIIGFVTPFNCLSLVTCSGYGVIFSVCVLLSLLSSDFGFVVCLTGWLQHKVAGAAAASIFRFLKANQQQQQQQLLSCLRFLSRLAIEPVNKHICISCSLNKSSC